MTKQFHAQLEALRGRVLAMAHLARMNVTEGVHSLVALDPGSADRVIERGEQLNRLDVEIERDALDLLALNQPMAQDLRTIGASLKIITYLDRIGRYGYDIAKVTKQMAGREHIRKPVSFTLMADSAMLMLDQAMKAYEERDAGLARAVPAQDNVVDALNEQIFRECVT